MRNSTSNHKLGACKTMPSVETIRPDWELPSPLTARVEVSTSHLSQLSQTSNHSHLGNSLENKIIEKMPKFSQTMPNNFYKEKALVEDDALDAKITEKFLKSESNETKKELNDFTLFKKSEINKIIRYNAERLFQIDEKPRCFLKAKTLGKYFF